MHFKFIKNADYKKKSSSWWNYGFMCASQSVNAWPPSEMKCTYIGITIIIVDTKTRIIVLNNVF